MSDPVEIVAYEGPAEIQVGGRFSSNPKEMVAQVQEIADVLSDIIDQKKLYTSIRGRKHVHAEGWTTMGAMLGVFPIVVETRESADFVAHIQVVTGSGNSRKVEVKQEGKGSIIARVEARTIGGALVGAAEGECGYGEQKWSDADPYAVRSMAQTRATAKALRLPLGFIIALAGYQATPEEEFNDTHVNKAKAAVLELVAGDKVQAVQLWAAAKEDRGFVETDDANLTQAQVEEIIDFATNAGGGETDAD